MLCLSFLGFDAVSTLSEEAKDPTRNVPRAIIATVVSGIVFVILSYLSQLVFPSNAFSDVDSGSLDVMRTAGGQFLETFFTTAAYVAGALGSALTSQASARILYAMGRDRILPRPLFAHISARFSTPVYAILVVSLVSLLAVVIDLATLASIVSFRCAGCLLGGEPLGDQALLHRPRRAIGAVEPGTAADRLRAHGRGCGPVCRA